MKKVPMVVRLEKRVNLAQDQAPLALFDALEQIKKQRPPASLTSAQKEDFVVSRDFLKAYLGSVGTFNSYRREIERLLHWAWLFAKKDLKKLKRTDLEAFVYFSQQPPKTWIGIKKAPRFVEKEGVRSPNPEWRPYVVTISKEAYQQGKSPEINHFALSNGAIKQLFAILSTFYSYLLQEEYVTANPIQLIRQKSKFIRKQQGPARIRRLSTRQWQYTINTAKKLAETEPHKHERTLFIMSILYLMYLRISELIASARWAPAMHHFQRDNDGNWWFNTVGKGNKQRQIAVSDEMLLALKRWRKHLGLSLLPSPADNSPLLPKITGPAPLSDASYIRKIVQNCFDQARVTLKADGYDEEAESLVDATVHWLRHTGISDDVKRRPREHVRDDAGHSSSVTTDRYIDIELKERHRSARHKPLINKS